MTSAKMSAAQVKRIEKALASVPFAKLLQLELEGVESGTATLALNVRKDLTQNHGIMHGGAIASLIDTATAFAILSVIEPKERVTTVDLTISYMRPISKGRVRAVARVVRAGRRLFVVSAEVLSGGKLAATALSTYIKV